MCRCPFIPVTGTELNPIDAQHPYATCNNGEGLARAEMPHVPEANSEHHHPATEPIPQSLSAFLDPHTFHPFLTHESSNLLPGNQQHNIGTVSHSQQERGCIQIDAPPDTSNPSHSVYAGQAFMLHHQEQQMLGLQEGVSGRAVQSPQRPWLQDRSGIVAAHEDTAMSAGDEWVLAPSVLAAHEGLHAAGGWRNPPTAEDSAFSAGSEWDLPPSQLGSFSDGGDRSTSVQAWEIEPFTNGDQYQLYPPGTPPDFLVWKP